MLATEVLKQEHRAVERVLRIIERASARLEAGEDVPASVFEDCLDFIRNFVDRCHHGKEEDYLFPALEKMGIPRQGGPVAVMLVEHDEGRGFVRAMVAAVAAYKRGDKAARAKLIENARGYASLLAQHIQKEDNILYAMGDQVLSAAKQQELVEAFERIEQERIGPGEHERYHAMIDRLETEVL